MINKASTTRRQFLKTSALAGGALLGPALLPRPAWATDAGPTLKIGLIGCGGRGTGATERPQGGYKCGLDSNGGRL